MTPPERLWDHFYKFDRRQIAALAPETEDKATNWYVRFARHPFYQPLGEWYMQILLITSLVLFCIFSLSFYIVCLFIQKLSTILQSFATFPFLWEFIWEYNCYSREEETVNIIWSLQVWTQGWCWWTWPGCGSSTGDHFFGRCIKSTEVISPGATRTSSTSYFTTIQVSLYRTGIYVYEPKIDHCIKKLHLPYSL